MIDPNILRELGWSDELITEVNRVADGLREAVPYFPEVPAFDFMSQGPSSTSIEPVYSTDTALSVVIARCNK